jgi:hypothetical protein
MAEAPGKSELLEQIDHEQAFWERLVAEIGEERIQEPGAAGAWTFKDVVAHLNGWRALTLARLDAARQGRLPAAPPWPAQLHEEDDTEEINAWIYEANRDRSLQQVLDEYRRSFQHMRDVVAALSERALSEPGQYSWLNGSALALVITNSFGHLHEEHEPALRAWLARRA